MEYAKADSAPVPRLAPAALSLTYCLRSSNVDEPCRKGPWRRKLHMSGFDAQWALLTDWLGAVKTMPPGLITCANQCGRGITGGDGIYPGHRLIGG